MGKILSAVCLLISFWGSPLFAETPGPYTVVSWNVQNWLETDRYIQGKWVDHAQKPESEQQAVIGILAKLQPDILAVQEMGNEKKYPEQFLKKLKDVGLDFPHTFVSAGSDDRIGLMLLSRFPMEAQNLMEDRYVVQGKEYKVQRGFLRAVVALPGGGELVLLVTHLKSRRASPPGQPNQTVMRQREAEALRRHVDAEFQKNPSVRLLVLGDFNDSMDSLTLKELLGAGETKLKDLWLKDSFGDWWTQFYVPAQTYSRFDYMLVSDSLFREWAKDQSGVYREGAGAAASLKWAEASDHRPIFAKFRLPEAKP